MQTWRSITLANDKEISQFELDLRGVKCPLNFVKTKLFLDKMETGQTVGVLLDAGEPVESVVSSIAAEGHKIVDNALKPEGHYCLTICKV